MDFNLIRQEDQAKVPFTTRLYASTIAEIAAIAKAENISTGAYVRHAINNALREYAQTDKQQTEVK